MPNAVYNIFKLALANGGIDLLNDTIKVLLVDSTYVPNISTHENVDDVLNEIIGTGYTIGGKELLNRTITVDTVNNRIVFDADDVSWPSASFIASGAIVYKDTGDVSTSKLITYLDLFGDNVVVNNTFTVSFDITGVIRIQ